MNYIYVCVCVCVCNVCVLKQIILEVIEPTVLHLDCVYNIYQYVLVKSHRTVH